MNLIKASLIVLAVFAWFLAGINLANAVAQLPATASTQGFAGANGSLVILPPSANTAPTITVSPSSVSYTVGATYSELGATCSDAEDGTIAVPAPTFSPALDMNTIGTYTATYTCTDSGGLTDSGTRSVSVSNTVLASFGPQSSTFAADNDFDFAETFDGLEVWGPQLTEGAVGENPADDEKMPKLIGGGLSAWTFYSKFGDDQTTTTDNWIDEYGDNRVWRGTKSAAIDLDNKRGPSRLGLFADIGYEEKFYYFFMVNISKNQWPTSCPYESDGTTATGDESCNSAAQGLYEEGQPYTNYASWKFMTFNYGCGFEECWDEPGAGGYSPVFHQISHFKNWGTYTTDSARGITGPIVLGIQIKEEMQGGETDEFVAGHTQSQLDGTIDDELGDWIGVEYSYTQDINGCTTGHDVWLYSKEGVARHVVDSAETGLVPNGATFPTGGCEPGNPNGYTWDYFFHGGNNSNTYTWGPTMQSVYYIDDVIIDDKRIGPKYFSIIGVTP